MSGFSPPHILSQMAASPMSLQSSSKRHHSHRLSNMAMKRTCQWIFSQEIPADVTIVMGETFFSLHKFPLVSKSGYMRRLVAETNESDLTTIRLPATFPGGAESFEQAAKFCYGINFEISATNVAGLHCAAYYLEMTEEYSPGNLLSRTDDFLEEMACRSFSGAVAVLRSCESLLPVAEELGIVTRCVESVAMNAVGEFNNWWAEELTALRIDFYQRVLIAMKAKGLSYRSLGSSIVHYAEKTLQKEIQSTDNDSSANKVEKEQRILIETIIGLLPAEKNSMSVSFLCGLLRSAILLGAPEGCKLDLEKRISFQLDQATVDDLLLIPDSSNSKNIIYGVDSVHRIAVGFLEMEKESEPSETTCYCSPSVVKVCRVLDNYLAEISHDPNLGVEKFVILPKLLPKQARDVEDCLYRAIDIYLKAHPRLDELQREKACSIMDCDRLSYEARIHASQNNRLPVHTVVQVLYFDQLRLRSTHADVKQKSPATTVAAFSSPTTDANASVIYRENEELKQELARMKTYVTNLQKDPQAKKTSFLSSVTKKLGKLNPFLRNVSKDTSNVADGEEAMNLPPRRRRFSIS